MISIKKSLFIMLAFCSLNVSCTDDFDKLNIDPNKVSTISPGTLLNPIIYEMATFNTSRSNAFTFEIMQVGLPYPSAAGGEHRYDISETAGNSTWNNYYRWIKNLKEMEAAAVAAEDKNYQAIALTLNAWVYSLLTDSFGDVPMDEAARGDEGMLHPAFNTQKEVYVKILADLEKASQLFDTAKPMIFGTDILYGSNVGNWKKFCNSLRLRLLLRVSKRTEMDAFAKMAEIINNPAAYPVFTKNEEAAVLQISGVTPLVSPWGRAIDFTTFRAISEFFADNLNQMNDPRRATFMTQAKSKDGKTSIGYMGIPSGYAGSDSQFDFIPSNHNIALVTAPMISVIMTYAEVEFIKAELAMSGHISSDAKTHYEAGVKAAMEQWGVALPENYFLNEKAAYDGTLERIMLQKYYALYFNDYQQWFEYRRTGYPVLPKTEAMFNNRQVPVRFKYPDIVQIYNAENYQKAVASMGADDINAKGWWEK